jgi:alpha-N-arabinofuranosidase
MADQDGVQVRSAEVHVGDGRIALSPFLHGALTEHFGYGIYGGIWDPGRDVPRADVQAAVRSLGITMFRYPGGCFADWYHWRDGVGPRADRPVHDRTYWTEFSVPDPSADPGLGRIIGPVETNAFGTDEFLRYCLDCDAEPMLVANFGSGDAQEAADWVRYTNRSGSAPRPVQWWSVGNEVFGPWEIGHCSGAEYGKKLVEFSEAMRAADPAIRIVAVGEAATPGSTFTAEVLREAGDVVDAISAHFYFPGPWIGRELRDDEADFLQMATGADELGGVLDQTLEDIDGVMGTDRAFPLALDEWNLWATWQDLVGTTNRLADAPLFAGFLNRMFERADRIQFAMVSHLVNCMAPIQTRGDRMFVTVGYLVQWLYRHEARAHAVPVTVNSALMAVPAFSGLSELAQKAILADGHGNARDARELDVSATADDSGVTVFLSNRRLDESLSVDVSGLPSAATARLRWLHAASPWSRNDEDHPDAVGFRDLMHTTSAAGAVTVVVPPHTVAALAVSR